MNPESTTTAYPPPAPSSKVPILYFEKAGGVVSTSTEITGRETVPYYVAALTRAFKDDSEVRRFGVWLEDEEPSEEIVEGMEKGVSLLVMSITPSETPLPPQYPPQSPQCPPRPPSLRLCPLWALLLHRKIEELLTNPIPWREKRPIAIWRGSTTGPDALWADPSARHLTRYGLVQKSNHILDAQFTAAVQWAKDNAFSLLLCQKMPPERQQRFRYIVVADGNVASYSLFWALASGSVVLKQQSPHRQWGEPLPKGCVVEVERDWSDITDKIQWLIDNDEEAQRIAERAVAFARENLSLEVLLREMRDVVFEGDDRLKMISTNR